MLPTSDSLEIYLSSVYCRVLINMEEIHRKLAILLLLIKYDNPPTP